MFTYLFKAFQQFQLILHAEGTNCKSGLAVVRNIDGFLSAFGDDTQNFSFVSQLQTHGVHDLEQIQDGIQGTDTFLRPCGCMGCLPIVIHDQVCSGIGNVIYHGVTGRVQNHGNIQFFESAVVQHDDLAAAAFLCGGAEYGDFSADIINDGMNCFAGSYSHGTHQIMSAGMTHSGNSVELPEDTDIGSFFSCVVYGLYGGLNPSDTCCHFKSEFLQKLGHGLTGMKFLKIIFRMFPNCVGKSDQLRQNLLYPLLYSLFKIAHLAPPAYFFIFGSRTSRIPSPRRLNPRTVTRINRPEIMAT